MEERHRETPETNSWRKALPEVRVTQPSELLKTQLLENLPEKAFSTMDIT